MQKSQNYKGCLKIFIILIICIMKFQVVGRGINKIITKKSFDKLVEICNCKMDKELIINLTFCHSNI